MRTGSKENELFKLYYNFYNSFITEHSCKIVQDALTNIEKMVGVFSYDKIFSTYLSYLKLTVKIDDKGNNHVNALEEDTNANICCPNIHFCLDDEDISFSITMENPFETSPIEVKEGSTVIQIQNLNIYLTADMVQQLNMNPQQVINHQEEDNK